MSDVNWAAWVPVILLGVAIVAYALNDIRRSEVLYLPKWAWVVVCLISIPLGAIVYLLAGRDRTSGS